MFLRRPPARPAPSDLTLRLYSTTSGSRSPWICLPSTSVEALQAHLVEDSSILVRAMLSATWRTKATTSLVTCLADPIISTERSSTKSVGTTLGATSMAASTMWIIMSFISVVAKLEPAVRPRHAAKMYEYTWPMRTTLGNL